MSGACPAHSTGRTGRRCTNAAGRATRPVADIMATLSELVRGAIRRRAEPLEDRSSIAFSVLLSMVRAECTDDEIRTVVWAHPEGIGARYADGKDLDADIRRAHQKARPPDAAEDTKAGAWSDPDLSFLGTGRRAAPVFPVDLLGP